MAAGWHGSVSGIRIFASSGHVNDRELGRLVGDLDTLGLAYTQSTSAGSWSPAEDVLLIPELGTAPALTASQEAELVAWVRSGKRLVSAGGSRNRDFLNTVFGWSLADGPSKSSFARATACSLFCSGPASLPSVKAVLDVVDSSLPSGAHAMYQTDTTVAVFLAILGKGEVIYLGSDWFTVDADWREALQNALSGEIPVSIYMNSGQVDTAGEGAKVKTSVTSAGFTFKTWTDKAVWNHPGHGIVIPELEKGALTLTADAISDLQEWVPLPPVLPPRQLGHAASSATGQAASRSTTPPATSALAPSRTPRYPSTRSRAPGASSSSIPTGAARWSGWASTSTLRGATGPRC